MALRHGATRQELMEAIWVAAEMGAEAPTRTPLSRWPRWTRRTDCAVADVPLQTEWVGDRHDASENEIRCSSEAGL